MKRAAILAGIFFTLCVNLYAGETKGPKSGFRDLKWGDPPSSDMTPDSSEDGLDYFTRASDRLMIGEVPLTEIRYGFLSNRLAKVTFGASTSYESDLVDSFAVDWGRPKKTTTGRAIQYAWMASESGRNKTAAIVSVIRGTALRVSILSVALERERETAQKPRSVRNDL